MAELRQEIERVLAGVLRGAGDAARQGEALLRSREISLRHAPRRSLAEIVEPLSRIFLPLDLLEDLLIHTNVPDLLKGQPASYAGVILWGPPGTGKSEALRQIVEVYQRAGAHAEQVSTTEIVSMWVGASGRSMQSVLDRAVTEAEKREIPSFVAFDEGEVLVERAAEITTGAEREYQSVIAALKRVLGNDRRVSVGISTNIYPDDVDPALVREGRLTPLHVPPPTLETRGRMWTYFAAEYDVISLTEEQAGELAAISRGKTGAFVEEFLRNYLAIRRRRVMREAGNDGGVADLLRGHVSMSENEVRETYSYSTLRLDLISELERKGDVVDPRLKEPNKPFSAKLREWLGW